MEASKPYCLEAQGLSEDELDLWGRFEDAQHTGDETAAISIDDVKGLRKLLMRLNDEANRLRQCLAATSGDVLDVMHEGKSVAVLHFLKNCDDGNRKRIQELFADVPGCKAGELRRAVLPLFMEMKRQKFRAITLTIDGSVCHFAGELEEGVAP